MVQYALQAAGCAPGEALVVGDRLYTDIACGLRAGVDTALVLSGEATMATCRPAPTSPPGFFPRWRSCGRAFLPDAAHERALFTMPPAHLAANA